MKLNEVVQPATNLTSRLWLLNNIGKLARKVFGDNYYDESQGHGVTEGPRLHKGNVLGFILSEKTPTEEIRKFIRLLKREGYPVHGKYKFFRNDDKTSSGPGSVNSPWTFEVLLDDPEFFTNPNR